MQINIVTQLTAAPSSAPTGADEAPRDKGFAKLLGDTDAKSGQERHKQSLPSHESQPAALAAQEVDAQVPPVQPERAEKLLSQPIGPEEAKALLAKLEAMGQHGKQQDPAFDHLKEALEDVVNGGEVTDLGSMLEALPETAYAQPADRNPALQRLLGWVAAAIDRHKEAPVAGAMPDGTAQSLQASLFPAGDDAAQRAAQAATQAQHDKKDDGAQAAAAVAILVPSTQNAAMPEWVKKLGEGEENIAAEAINEAIPALALPDEEVGLPAVKLPGGEDYVGTKVESKFAARDFHELLANAPVANDNDEQATPVVSVDANGVISAPNAPSAQNTSSLTPITVSAHSHLATHTAAAEQVHVAITSMKKDELTSITLQLEPADMGRVEIKMDMIDGKAQLSFLVDKAETLDALARDARSLERQLQEAGVRADAGSMQFNLRQQAQQETAEDDKGGKRRDGELNEAAAIEGAVTKHYTLNVREGVDIQA